MEEFRYDEDFMPSRTTRKQWQSTHKTPKQVDGVTLPGLFQTTYFGLHVTGFFLILILEGLATYWSYIKGTAITAIMVSIFIDLVLALLAHLKVGTNLAYKNELIFESNTVKRQAIQYKIKSNNFFSAIFIVLILISAVFKFIWFYWVYLVFDSAALFVLACYLIGAALHIYCTGYAWYTAFFKIRLSIEHKAYINSGGNKFKFSKNIPELSLPFDTTISINETEVDRHKLIKDSGGNYLFQTFGILTDKQLMTFIGRQSNAEQRRAVAINGVKHQHSML